MPIPKVNLSTLVPRLTKAVQFGVSKVGIQIERANDFFQKLEDPATQRARTQAQNFVDDGLDRLTALSFVPLQRLSKWMERLHKKP